MVKTNVMRILDANKIPYIPHEYNPEETDGQTVAKLINKDEDSVFKTLVTVNESGEHFVFVVPVSATLNLKKAAISASVKRIEMIKQKELLTLTGYVHGGCSPIGMKKPFKTFVDETAILFNSICFSAGKKGKQVEVEPNVIVEFLNAELATLTD